MRALVLAGVAPIHCSPVTKPAMQSERRAFFRRPTFLSGWAAWQRMQFASPVATQDTINHLGEPMDQQRDFVPIASRDLTFIGSDGFRMSIHVAISAPYMPADTEGMEQLAACQVLTCSDPTLATEVFGADKVEALVAGLEFLELFLVNLVRTSGGGQLVLGDGSVFDPAGSILLKESRRLAAKNVR